jgi:putative ABC transport system ATP-binding protein
MQPPVLAPPRVALEATDLVKTYGSGGTAVRALDGVTATFTSGEFTAIMGPSGSGSPRWPGLYRAGAGSRSSP